MGVSKRGQAHVVGNKPQGVENPTKVVECYRARCPAKPNL